ncbi:hypothetical protein OIU74_020735 [Salix koriyanagi]|uniref:Uncharacterized protein n=1 Tax=Salix koriyanagi TaxID=2511006 RepID=A0A9Q0P790_9ROSI|nr:hypothetical protein OIU74_020735 [Salix koriyanagi]
MCVKISVSDTRLISFTGSCGDFLSQPPKLFCCQLSSSTLCYCCLCIYAKSLLSCFFHHKFKENEFYINSVCNLWKDGDL